MKKFNNDAALAVAEEAFRAGFKASLKRIGAHWDDPKMAIKQEEEAWSDFESSEDVKALING